MSRWPRFKILYGPPFFNPPILFIGYQPGGGAEDCARELLDGAHDGWPAVCEYATESWKLAYWMRRMFGAELLTRCVGLNAIFVRAPKVEIYRKTVASSVREKIEKFCLPRVEQLIDVMQPQRIVSVGFETLDLFGGGVPDLQKRQGAHVNEDWQDRSAQGLCNAAPKWRPDICLNLQSRLGGVFDKLRGRGALSEADVDSALGEVRAALIDADVALPVVKDFIDKVRPRAIGESHPLGHARPAGRQDRP
jgi:hypothetical protein